MSITTLISPGYPQTLELNVVYALPVRACKILVEDTCEISNETTFTAFGTVSSNTPTTVAGAFIRCTNSTTTIVANVF